ncbi:hypothetical protein ACLBVT_30575 [Pseudomonas aeruginosa]|uniref:hypothetical protein n=1 Tax=Pseudomonas aeruginosa TaxID=287 RepID=UPI0039681A83
MVDEVAARAAAAPFAATDEEARHALVYAGVPRHILVVDQVPAGQGPALAWRHLAAVIAHRTDPHDQPGALLLTPFGRHLAMDAEHGGHGHSQELELQLLEESDPDQLEVLSEAKLLEQLTERRSSSSTADISSAWLTPNGSPWCTGVE